MGVERDKTIDELLEAREAYARRDWAVALDRMRGMGPRPRRHLCPGDICLSAGPNVDGAIRALQSGYQDRIRNEDWLGAARFASWLGLLLNVRGESAVGGGWVAASAATARDRARRRRRAWVHSWAHEFFQHLGRGDFARRARRPLASSRPVAASPKQTWQLKA